MVCGLHIFQRFIWKPIQYQLHIIVKREARLDQIYKTDLNELFSYQRKGEKLEEKEKVIEIEIERLRDFKEHPFHVKDDKEMSLLKESIKNYGILSPLIVRPVLDPRMVLSETPIAFASCVWFICFDFLRFLIFSPNVIVGLYQRY